MNSTILYSVPLLCLVVLSPARLAAHALLAEDLLVSSTVVLLAAQYSGGEAAAYNAVQVYPPGTREVEFQNGRTDAQGRFAYSPNTAGLWTVIISDTMGHRVVHTTEVPAASAHMQPPDTAPVAAPTPRQEQALFIRILLGFSLLANIFFTLYLYKKARHR